MSDLTLVIANLTSPPVLAFALGLLAVSLGGNIKLPDAAYQLITTYLLLAIGLKGGVALATSDVRHLAWPIVTCLALGIVLPILAFIALRFLTSIPQMDRGAIAAHYGSTSLVTFAAALSFLDSEKITYEGFVPTLLTVLEVPGIIVGLALAVYKSGSDTKTKKTLHEILTSKSIVLLIGGLVMGVLTGPTGFTKVEPLFSGLYSGILTLFLLDMGALAGTHIKSVRKAGVGLAFFAIMFPICAGTLGVLSGHVIGLSLGGATVLGVLCASASYIAAPAAVRIALPKANPSYSLTASLGITFPFNLIIGIPLYLEIARRLAG